MKPVLSYLGRHYLKECTTESQVLANVLLFCGRGAVTFCCRDVVMLLSRRSRGIDDTASVELMRDVS